MYVTELSTRAVGSTVMKEASSEAMPVTGTISDITVGWISGFGCLLCEVQSCVVVSVTSGCGPPRESLVVSSTGDGYAGIVVNSAGISKLSADGCVCGEKMVQIISGSERVVLLVSFCRTLSSVYCVSASSYSKKLSHWLLTIKGRAVNTKYRKRE